MLWQNLNLYHNRGQHTKMKVNESHLNEGCHVLLVERGAREGEALEGAKPEDVAGGLHVDDLEGDLMSTISRIFL